MRSPWQVLKSFASRGKPEDVQTLTDDVPAASGPSEEATSTESPAESTPPDTHIAQVSVGAPEQPALVSANLVQTIPVPGRSSPPRTEPTDPVAAVEGAMVSSSTIGAKAKQPLERQVKKRRPKEQSPAMQETRLGPTAQRLAPQAPLSDQDQAVELDAEINDLRLRLAQKLIEQNGQLRKMLDRYGD